MENSYLSWSADLWFGRWQPWSTSMGPLSRFTFSTLASPERRKWNDLSRMSDRGRLRRIGFGAEILSIRKKSVENDCDVFNCRSLHSLFELSLSLTLSFVVLTFLLLWRFNVDVDVVVVVRSCSKLRLLNGFLLPDCADHTVPLVSFPFAVQGKQCDQMREREKMKERVQVCVFRNLCLVFLKGAT